MSDLLARLQDAVGDAYRVEKELGGGGMSRVFLATEVSLRRQVVIKLLPPEFASEVSEARFKQEIELAAHLQHPNILPVLAAGARDDLLYYVMPFVSGESLRHRLTREGKLPVADAARILHEVADALAYAHAEGVIHRDVKPENILLEGGHAVLTDFGVARALLEARSGRRLTETGMAVGTPAYMSPEQAAGERHVDARADVYALAVVGYEMLAGVPPFQGSTPQALLAAHRTEMPKPLQEVRRDVPAPVSAAIVRALAKDPTRRLHAAAAFRDAIGGLAGPAAAVQPAARRTPSRVGGTVIIAGAVAVGLAAAFALWRRGVGAGAQLDPQVVAVFPFRVSGADPSLQYLREGMIDLLAAKLTGEGGPRAADPRSTMSAWHRAVTSDDKDLPEDASLRLAQRLGAGQVLLGGIVGTPSHLAISAKLLVVPGGRTRAQASVGGSPDSLPMLIDQLTAQVLARGSGEEEQRLASLTSTSLAALRTYLDGQAAYRRSRYSEAAQQFEQALQLDSTFALAGLGLASATFWSVSGQLEPGLGVAWAHRGRLSPHDRAVVIALAGPRYPAPPSSADQLPAWERAVEAAPDRPEPWYWLGEVYFHQGALLGLDGPRQRAATAFKRALELDSAFTPPMQHLVDLAAQSADTASARRLGALHPDRDAVAGYVQWRVALALGDSMSYAAVRTALSSMATQSLWGIIGTSMLDGIALEDAERASAVLTGRAGTRTERWIALFRRHHLALNRGRPEEALAITEAMREVQPSPRIHLHRRVFDALYWEGDSTAASEAVGQLAQGSDQPLPRWTEERESRYADMCTVEQWRLWHRELTTAARAIAMLRSAAVPMDSPRAVVANALCATVLEALLGAMQGGADALAALDRLDSLSRRGPTPTSPVARAANLVAGRLREARGDLPGALAVVRRRLYFEGSYLSSYLREEGRLAALTGDRAGAIRAYQHYLALRSDPEPAVKPEVERVKAALARLVGEQGPS